MELVAAVIGRAHGLHGEVSLDVRTDRVAQRLAPGAVFATDPPQAGPVTLLRLRESAKGWLAQFEELSDRTAAEAARGVQLLVAADDEDDAWYPHELAGLAVVTADGGAVGQVRTVEFGAAQDLLVIDRPDAEEVRVPLLAQFVPRVDVPGGRIVIDPPDGLLA